MDTNPYFLSSHNNSKDVSKEDTYTTNAAGFGATVEGFADLGIDLNEQLIRNRPATFFMRVNSDAMIGAGIHTGDVVIVDRSLPASNGKVIIAIVDGELLIRRLEITNGKKRLLPATNKLAPISLTEIPLQVWGVVTYVIHGV